MIIGSVALKHWFPDLNREPKDVDIIKNMYITEYETDKKVEWLENKVLQNYFTKPIEIITPNELYTLKISHAIGWKLENNSFDKHLWDIQFMKEKGCVLIEPLFYDLYEYWKSIHGDNKRSDLNMSADDFFNNAIKFPVEHDILHELLIKHPYFNNQSAPTYTKILKGEVDVCMDKFSNLTEEEKFNVVFEEVAVMSLENRFSKKMYWKTKYERMLKKFITSHAKIEESLWIIQNHKKLLCNLPFNYEQFLNLEISKN